MLCIFLTGFEYSRSNPTVNHITEIVKSTTNLASLKNVKGIILVKLLFNPRLEVTVSIEDHKIFQLCLSWSLFRYNTSRTYIIQRVFLFIRQVWVILMQVWLLFLV